MPATTANTTTIGTLCLIMCGLCTPARAQDLPPDGEYVVVRDGHLYQNGKRVRFWGGIGGGPAFQFVKNRKGRETGIIRRVADRLEAYGFNMMRVWDVHRSFDKQPQGYAKGDRSDLDLHDELIAELKRRGFKLWVGGGGAGGRAVQSDAGVVDEPATAEAWKTAIGKKGVDCAHYAATFWDPRLEAIAIRNNARYLDRVNHHTGLRVGDDPVFAVWELTNEQWWTQRMVGGGWQNLPKLFRDSLLAKWHGFLKDKYGTQDALSRKWCGMLPGEDLARGTVLFAPMRNAARVAALNDANPHAAAKLESVKMKYGRDDFNMHRSRDVLEFVAQLLVGHKRRVAAAFKKNGKSARLCPLLWDTGMGYNGINQLMHQQADAVSYCAYVAGMTHDESHARYPWISGLEEPPRICLDVPWLEHNKVEGKPFFCYETNIGSPAKFRAEFPYRILFLATVQDWDVVCWHTLSGGYRWDDPDPLVGSISSPGHAAAQFNFQHDEVLISAVHAAGKMFVDQSLKPAPMPTKFIFGRKTIFDPASMDYAGSYGRNGRDMLNTVYRYGSRIEIDLDRDDDEVIGPTVRLSSYGYPNPLAPTDQMIYDWHKGYVRFDSPSSAAYAGFLAKYGKDRVEFDSGVVFSDISVHNPTDAPYPVTPEENYVAVAVTSTDGKPMAECRRAVISAVSTSANKGLVVGRDPACPDRPGHPWEASKVFEGAWKTPVVVSRVNCTVKAPGLAGMTYRMRDWKWNVVDEGVVGPAGLVVIPADKPVFIVELEL